MEELNRLEELERALVYAEAEELRADRMLAAGDITFRMFLEFQARVSGIRAAIGAEKLRRIE